MTTSSIKYTEAFAWIWLPGSIDPVVAGRISRDEHGFSFVYGKSYLARSDAIAIYDDLPLVSGVQRSSLPDGLAGSIRDAAPDS